MQREKLYNLHKTAYIIAALFVFQIDNIFTEQISTVQKYIFFKGEQLTLGLHGTLDELQQLITDTEAE